MLGIPPAGCSVAWRVAATVALWAAAMVGCSADATVGMKAAYSAVCSVGLMMMMMMMMMMMVPCNSRDEVLRRWVR